jgi:HD-GYP domain-containing protein (c-di-GMP phosphodiesterase class II)
VSKFKINLHETIFSLSDALDLVGVDQVYHSKRVAYLAVECGKALNLSKDRLDDLFLAAILHDCGVFRTAIHAKLTHFEANNVGKHCDMGSELLQRAPLLAHLSEYVLYHHTPWNKLIDLDLQDVVRIIANCIYMVDRVDILVLNGLEIDPNILGSKDKIRNKIRAKRGHWFQPELVDIFLKLSESEAFWLSLVKVQNAGYPYSGIAYNSILEVEFEELKSIVSIFSHIVDAKSTYTEKHSDGVANLSRFLGVLFELSAHTCDMLELAGLLHDLGMLRVPDKILDKPGELTEAEDFIVRRHSYDTYEILKNIKGFEDISKWAAQHHERLDGSGYPYRSNAKELSLEARIIAVADVFQTLTQKRPYRDKFSPKDIMSVLKNQMQEGKLDKEVVLMVENNLTACWKLANNIETGLSSVLPNPF